LNIGPLSGVSVPPPPVVLPPDEPLFAGRPLSVTLVSPLSPPPAAQAVHSKAHATYCATRVEAERRTTVEEMRVVSEERKGEADKAMA
jgi:hypothetical protein